MTEESKHSLHVSLCVIGAVSFAAMLMMLFS